MNDLPLTTKTEMSQVVKTMRKSDSGLDVKTRMWLKITIPDAFIGLLKVVCLLKQTFIMFKQRR